MFARVTLRSENMSVLSEKIKEKAVDFENTNDVADEILELVGDASFVLIGEASHGTHEFYKYRAEITKKLIAEKDFSRRRRRSRFSRRLSRQSLCARRGKRPNGERSAFRFFALSALDVAQRRRFGFCQLAQIAQR